MRQVTKRKKEILDYIASYTRSHGYSPSYREIMHAFQLSSVGSIFKHIKNLQTKGLLQKGEQKSRSTVLSVDLNELKDNEESTNQSHIPIIGSISKGKKIELFAQANSITFGEAISGKNAAYAFLVKDHSFQELGIHCGDIIAIALQEEVKNGAMVLATGENDATFLGHYFREKNHIQIEESTFIEDSLCILGTLVALFRSYNKEPSLT